MKWCDTQELQDNALVLCRRHLSTAHTNKQVTHTDNTVTDVCRQGRRGSKMESILAYYPLYLVACCRQGMESEAAEEVKSEGAKVPKSFPRSRTVKRCPEGRLLLLPKIVVACCAHSSTRRQLCSNNFRAGTLHFGNRRWQISFVRNAGLLRRFRHI
jgi:hypothetical protein